MSKTVATCSQCGMGMARADGSTHHCRKANMFPGPLRRRNATQLLLVAVRRQRKALEVLKRAEDALLDAERVAYDCNIDPTLIYLRHGINRERVRL